MTAFKNERIEKVWALLGPLKFILLTKYNARLLDSCRVPSVVETRRSPQAVYAVLVFVKPVCREPGKG